MLYRKNPKHSDTPKIAVIIRTESFYYRCIGSKDIDRTANSVDPDQTAPVGADTVCSDLYVRKLRNITVLQ